MRSSLFVYCAPLFCCYVLRPLVGSHSHSLLERHRRGQLLPHARTLTHWCGWIHTMTAHPRANTAQHSAEWIFVWCCCCRLVLTQIHSYYILLLLLKLRCYNSRRRWLILLLKQSTKSKKEREIKNEPTDERPHCQTAKPWNSCTPFICHSIGQRRPYTIPLSHCIFACVS